jgi:class 3 adenylate cyclase
LTDIQFDTKFMPNLASRQRRIADELIAVHKSQVANQDGDAFSVATGLTTATCQAMLIGENLVGNSGATTRERTVHDVIVKKSESVQKFKGRTSVKAHLRIGVATGADETPMTKSWTQALSPRSNEAANLGDWTC